LTPYHPHKPEVIALAVLYLNLWVLSMELAISSGGRSYIYLSTFEPVKYAASGKIKTA